VAAQLAAPQEGLSSVSELVIAKLSFCFVCGTLIPFLEHPFANMHETEGFYKSDHEDISVCLFIRKQFQWRVAFLLSYKMSCRPAPSVDIFLTLLVSQALITGRAARCCCSRIEWGCALPRCPYIKGRNLIKQTLS
jgi:hypothetical protein